MNYIGAAWDMLIAFPPCTHLCVSGARWFKGKAWEQQQAILFAEALWRAPIPRIAIENPIGVLSTQSRLGKPTQIIQPWQHGHETTKATCLWLRGLPKLKPSNIVSAGERKTYANGKSSPLWHANSGGGQGKKRSITFEGIALAMAEQWHGD